METPTPAAGAAIDMVFAARDGDAAALEQLWTTCRDYLRLAAARELSTELRAKLSPSDIVQDTLTAAQQSLGQFRGTSDEELHGWLRRILHNQVTQAHRRFLAADKRDVRREQRLDGGPGLGGNGDARLEQHATPWRKLVADERAVALQALLASLPDDYRRVVRARAFERRSFAEIAAELGRSEGAIRKLWLRGLERLAEEWPAHDSGSSV
ncbi:MAG: sigma-70 family RNA polymerase sigma factor [Pirellulales bacterium]|nr:sigma-70 family RNA polymerase sigma factor [Pirellulales bacterium]